MEQNKKYEPEIDFKSLIKKPKRLFGWVFVYFFLIILIVGIYYVNNLNTINVNTLPAKAPVKDEVKRTLEVKSGSVMPAVDISTITDPTDELINKGKDLYKNNCASCHGESGLGDGVAGMALNPPARNLTKLDGWKNGVDFPGLYKTLEEGIPQTGMVAYEFLSPVDRIAMIQYIRTLADYPSVTDDQVQELEMTYKLSEGRTTSDQITVEMAFTQLVNEKSHPKRVANLLAYVNNHPTLQGADVFNKTAVNKHRVLTSFLEVDFVALNLADFIQIVNVNFIELGFSAEVNLLERTEWQNLYNYLKNVLGTARA
ncbi:putative lipoprotein [hydrocarbon metagenome]|uniref:Putative lipoprotein n=1 Tax=hydrocarbon metagenome TaxID=938273 RepID=A0A0W8FX09_9ZZZZ